ncbi:MAG: transcriptional regulator NanR [Rhodobiaceae bacterium]|nr:transcriptional regulator NanR [Rhodobiaceae bacterium]
MANEYAPIQRRKLSDDVEERLLGLVERGNLKPGDTLPSERQLMEAYGVGRPAIREALQNLQRMGLIEIRHGGRPRVAAPSMESIFGQLGNTVRHMLSHSETNLKHLKEARATFEMEMARIAARQRTAPDIAMMEAILRKQTEAASDQQRFLAHDGEFHVAIARISGNPIFVSLCEALFDWLAHFHVDLVSRPGLENLTIDEHHEILGAIEAGDPDAASKAMSDHLYRANRLYHKSHLRRDR